MKILENIKKGYNSLSDGNKKVVGICAAIFLAATGFAANEYRKNRKITPAYKEAMEELEDAYNNANERYAEALNKAEEAKKNYEETRRFNKFN